MIAEALRSEGDCSTEEHRHRLVRDGAHAWHWRTYIINNSVMVSFKKNPTDVELDKTDFKAKEQTNK